MTSELSFLIDLLLKHKLPTATKALVADRIAEVEANIGKALNNRLDGSQRVMPNPLLQAPSTQALLDKHAELAIAQSPAAIAALESRNKAIAESIAGTIDKANGRPRKF